jgi:hypothetical protein
MMAPALAIAGMGMSVAQGIMGASAAAQQGEAEANRARYLQAIAQMNAKYAEEQATQDVLIGEQRAQQVGLQARGKAGLATAQAGARGLDPNTGSARAVSESELAIGNQDEAVRRNEAQMAAWKSRVAAAQDTAQGQVYGMEAQYAKEAAGTRSMTSLLSAGSQIVSQGIQAQRFGVFGGAGGGAVPPGAMAAATVGSDAAPTNYYDSGNYPQNAL